MSKSNVKLTLVAILILAGCAAPIEEPEETGFLSDYSNLEMVEQGKIGYFGDRIAEDDRFIIAPSLRNIR